jgi:8-oxo-dGTP pyrophosphatase MutT (NUDIX family)
VELRHILSARRPAGLRELSAAPPAPSGVEAGAWDADWLRARLAGPDPVSEDPAFAWADDAALAADIPLAEAAVLVALITGERPGVLLTKRSSALRRHGGQVSFPGGRIDPEDASPEAAALREAQEEIGLDPLRVKVAGRLTPYVTGTGYRVTPVVGTLARGFTLTLSPFEVESVLELPLETLLDSTAPQSILGGSGFIGCGRIRIMKSGARPRRYSFSSRNGFARAKEERKQSFFERKNQKLLLRFAPLSCCSRAVINR